MSALRTLVLGCVTLAACRAPTEIELTIHTDLPCTERTMWQGVAVYVGAAGPGLESKESTLVTHACDKNGLVGSLVITPSGEDDDLVGVRVVAGTTTLPEDCHDKGYEGCIVARRRLRFRPNQKLSLDVELEGQCEYIPCDSDSTCLSGTCIGVSEVARSEPKPQAEPPMNKRVRCGDNGLFCATTGNVCCLTVDVANKTSHGECKPSTDCPSTSSVLNCDDAADCAPEHDADGSPALCMLSYVANGIWEQPVSISSSSCLTITAYKAGNRGQGLALCQDRQSCPRGTNHDVLQCDDSGPADQNHLPGYSWCLWNEANEM
jgi:hypothetical protein